MGNVPVYGLITPDCQYIIGEMLDFKWSTSTVYLCSILPHCTCKHCCFCFREVSPGYLVTYAFLGAGGPRVSWHCGGVVLMLWLIGVFTHACMYLCCLSLWLPVNFDCFDLTVMHPDIYILVSVLLLFCQSSLLTLFLKGALLVELWLWWWWWWWHGLERSANKPHSSQRWFNCCLTLIGAECDIIFFQVRGFTEISQVQ